MTAKSHLSFPHAPHSAARGERCPPNDLKPLRQLTTRLLLINSILILKKNMKKFQLTLALAAMIAGSTFAFAFQPAAPVHHPFLTEWVRTGTSTHPDDNTWQQQSTGTCNSADDICKANFPNGYNPNMHSYSTNVTNAIVLEDQGYVQP